jgi:cobalt/nickel transport protein
MSNRPNRSRNNLFVLLGLSTALLIAVVLSPFASSDPDGLDRVSQDLGFEQQAQPEPIAHKLPFYAVFEEYAVRGVPEAVATPLAGLVGTLVTFGLAWGAGKLLVKNSRKNPPESDFLDHTSR